MTRPALLRDDERDVTQLLTAGTDEQTLRVHPQERFARLIDEVRIPVGGRSARQRGMRVSKPESRAHDRLMSTSQAAWQRGWDMGRIQQGRDRIVPTPLDTAR
jgi:hypothetical protein